MPPEDAAAPLGAGAARGEPSPRADREQLLVLGEIARLATEDLELRPMLQRITDALARRFSWELVALVRILPDRRRFVCEALTTELATEVHVGYGRDLGSGVVGREEAERGEGGGVAGGRHRVSEYSGT